MTLISPVEDKQLELENIRPTHLTCTKCKESLPIEQFYDKKGRTSNYGKTSDCKSCRLSMNVQWRLKNPFKYVLNNAKQRYKKRPNSVPQEFNIDEDYLKQIDTTDICPILGIPMQWYVDAGKNVSNGTRILNPNSKSLDRIDSSRGYIKGNILIISWRANQIKQDSTREELIKLGKWAETNL
jgi:hypothetical protein